jgi:pilus assembly protein CpaE
MLKLALVNEKEWPLHAKLKQGGEIDTTQFVVAARNLSSGIGKNSADVILLGPYACNPDFVAELEKFVLKSPTIPVLLVCSDLSPDILIAVMRAGVREVLPNDNESTVLEAIKRVGSRVHSSGGGSGGCRQFGFISAKGGDGGSCVAANLAAAIAELNTEARILALDLSLPFGDLEMYLSDTPAKHDLADFSDEVDRLDTSLLESMVHPVSENLELIASPRAFEKVIHVVPDNVSRFLEIAGAAYQFQVIDLGSSIDPVGLQVIERLDYLVIVATLTMPSLRRTGQLLRLCESLGYPLDKVLVVVNKYSSKAAISKDDFESAMGKKIFKLLPQDSDAVQESLLKGVSIVSNTPKSPLTREIKDWASELTGISTNESKSLWHRFGIK